METKPVEPTIMERLVATAELLLAQAGEVARLEELLKQAKAEFRRTERDTLPSLMDEVALKEIRLKDGTRIIVKDEFEAKLTDATRVAALRWLTDNGFGGLVKTSVVVEFGRGEYMEAEMARLAVAKQCPGRPVTVATDVHSSTLKAFVREQLTAGNQLPVDLFNISPYSKAIIKE